LQAQLAVIATTTQQSVGDLQGFWGHSAAGEIYVSVMLAGLAGTCKGTNHVQKNEHMRVLVSVEMAL
jgi:hypothetical protein